MRKILLHFFRMMIKYVLSVSLPPYAEHFTSYMSHNMCLTLSWYIWIHTTPMYCTREQETTCDEEIICSSRKSCFLSANHIKLLFGCSMRDAFSAQRPFKYLLIHLVNFFFFASTSMIFHFRSENENYDEDEMGVSRCSFFKFERWDGENHNRD